MTLKAALVTVLLWGVTFAGIGAAMGATLGMVAPGYYRTVFRHSNVPDFSPLHVGIGLGTIQGAAAGVVISIVVLALIAWRDACSAPPISERQHSETIPQRRTWSVHVLWGLVTAMSVFVVSGITLVVGGIIAQEQLYQSWTDRKLNKLAIILQADEYARVEAGSSSAAYVYLTGMVTDNVVREALHDRLVVAFGSDEAEIMIRGVRTTQ